MRPKNLPKWTQRGEKRMDEQEFCKKAMELGATGAGVVSLADVTPDPQFRDLCALNYCCLLYTSRCV